MSAGVRLLVTTVDSDDQAVELVRRLLDGKWIACGNILPAVRSLYRWQGEVCDQPEVMIWMKTTPEKALKAMAKLEEWHPYDTPAIEVMDVAAAPPMMIDWLHRSVE